MARRLGPGGVRPASGRRVPALLSPALAAVAVVSALAGASGWYGVPAARLLAHGAHRVLPAVPVRHAGGTFAFLHEAAGPGGQPVSYNPCRTVEVEHNPAGAPAGADRLVRQAVHRVSAATGLDLEVVGDTRRRPPQMSPTVGLQVAGGRPPVLIAWSTPAETPGLAGPVAGLGGSTARTGMLRGTSRYVTGTVVLDAPTLGRVEERTHGAALVRAVILHELGHVVGLADVTDPGELMNARNAGRTSFGPGDREGLARLGQGPCRG